MRKLKQQHHDTYSFFQSVWSVRNNHIMTSVPEQYVFYLRCCFQPSCIHPLCAQHDQVTANFPTTWFPDGPAVEFLPFPVRDPSRPWGSTECSECGIGSQCHGHYMKPDDLLLNIVQSSSTATVVLPPSTMIKDFFNRHASPTDEQIQTLAKSVLLPVDEVQMWLSHLEEVQKNRKRGAAKAAATRKAKQHSTAQSHETESIQGTKLQIQTVTSTEESSGPDAYFCGTCGKKYEKMTDAVENWIACDKCDSWFHWVCVGITTEPEQFLCSCCLC